MLLISLFYLINYIDFQKYFIWRAYPTSRYPVGARLFLANIIISLIASLVKYLGDILATNTLRWNDFSTLLKLKS
jgi:hypothetical protein